MYIHQILIQTNLSPKRDGGTINKRVRGGLLLPATYGVNRTYGTHKNRVGSAIWEKGYLGVCVSLEKCVARSALGNRRPQF